MGIMRFKYTIYLLLFAFFLANGNNALAQGGGADSGSAANAAQTCQIAGGSLFPSNPSSVSQYGDHRPPGSKGPRKHTGLDLFYPVNHTVPQPPGCEILVNDKKGYRFNNKNEAIDDASGKIVGSDKGGYGHQLYYRCGKPDGDQITLRYAHVPLNPITASKQILQGCSGSAGCGSASHYHFEIVIGNRPVDPECVMYGKKPQFNTNVCDPQGNNCARAECHVCPEGIGAGPANLCDKSVRDKLIQHGKLCSTTSRFPDGQTRNVPGGEAIDPNRLGPTNGEPDAGSDQDPPGGHSDHDHLDGEDNATTDGGYYGDDIDIVYPPEVPDAPVVPPPPPIPGTPGDEANLTPPPEEGKEPQELSGCATDTWTAMVNQGIMEARREDLLNKRFIVKNDSVLQYSCFNKALQNAAKSAPIFSGGDHWAKRTVPIFAVKPKKDPIVKIYEKDQNVEQPYRDTLLKPKTLEESLTLLVDDFYNKYLEDNFDYKVLAGTTNMSDKKSLCVDMSQVWKAAKCKNFDSTTVFYTFDDLISKDPREFPPGMECGG